MKKIGGIILGIGFLAFLVIASYAAADDMLHMTFPLYLLATLVNLLICYVGTVLVEEGTHREIVRKIKEEERRKRRERIEYENTFFSELDSLNWYPSPCEQTANAKPQEESQWITLDVN